jgi:hypothetical protein
MSVSPSLRRPAKVGDRLLPLPAVACIGNEKMCVFVPDDPGERAGWREQPTLIGQANPSVEFVVVVVVGVGIDGPAGEVVICPPAS